MCTIKVIFDVTQQEESLNPSCVAKRQLRYLVSAFLLHLFHLAWALGSIVVVARPQIDLALLYA